MATIFPDLQRLSDPDYRRVTPTALELQILRYLAGQLNDEYEVYFRPFFNGFRPPIVIFRMQSGILILDVYENLSDADGTHPKKKFDSQKFELLNLVLSPAERKTQRSNLLKSVHGMAIFAQAQEEVNKRFGKVEYYSMISISTLLNQATFRYFLKKCKMVYNFAEYPHEAFREIKRYLKPSLHLLEEGKVFHPNARQSSLMQSRPGDQRVHGPAGTGKTTILAHKAVLANTRTGEEVLILSFNITIRHYIRHKLEEVASEFHRTDFHISHYHDFFKHQAIEFTGARPQIGDWEDTEFFESTKERLPKYSTIIIDEAQDYKTEWAKILKRYFLKLGGEFVIYVDVNQDIYRRRSIAAFPIAGRPNLLSRSYRLSPRISRLTQRFRERYMGINEVNDAVIEPLELDFREFRENITYRFFPSNVNSLSLYEYIKSQIVVSDSSPDDIAIIGTSIEKLRDLEHHFRSIKGELTTRMFESQEEYEELMEKFEGREGSLECKLALKELRREYKLYHFDLVTGSMKFSSLHSFKGWEIHTIFLLIVEGEQDENEIDEGGSWVNDELVYTGITRARRNLNVINIGCHQYHGFFSEAVSE